MPESIHVKLPALTTFLDFLRYAARVAQKALDTCHSRQRREGLFLTFVGPPYAMWLDPTIVPEGEEAVDFSEKGLVAASALLTIAIKDCRHQTLTAIWSMLGNPRKYQRRTRRSSEEIRQEHPDWFSSAAEVEAIHEEMASDGAILLFRYEGRPLLIPIYEDPISGRPIENDSELVRRALMERNRRAG